MLKKSKHLFIIAPPPLPFNNCQYASTKWILTCHLEAVEADAPLEGAGPGAGGVGGRRRTVSLARNRVPDCSADPWKYDA